MLVVAWDALDAAIPRIEAEENYAAYTVAVLATPHAEEESRNSILGSWRALITGGIRSLTSTNENSETAQPKKYLDTPLKHVVRRLRDAFGNAIRD